ncbi:hypothetical protein BB561_005654 [Smittium simulii]|uniref:Methyltransferase small domain-containing protein n=1 Tax=Smittium simulii TaxID=133385 RepID=A0A2T9Y9A1_9FUNG|nr:hypothetical protein BB561_005654 [Smittium simulii]
METPFYSHLKQLKFSSVYPPSEDTFVLLDALEADAEFLKNRGILSSITNYESLESITNYESLESITNYESLEVGSGIVSAFAGQVLDKQVVVVGTDINAAALDSAQLVVADPRNKLTKAGRGGKLPTVSFEFISSNNLVCLRDSFKFDLVVYNPPYVETDISEVGTITFSALSGGPDSGRNVLLRLCAELVPLLSSCSVFYLVLIARNRPEVTLDLISDLIPALVSASIVLDRRAGIEHLFVLRFVVGK